MSQIWKYVRVTPSGGRVRGVPARSSTTSISLPGTPDHLSSQSTLILRFVMSIMEHNGGSVVAMAGKNCVAIACDLRLGAGAQTIATNFEKIFPVTDRMYLGLAGLASDVVTLREKFRYLTNMFLIKESRPLEPSTFAHLVSSTLYERRFGPYFCEPVLAGLERTPSGSYKPYIVGTDLIGCLNFAKDFIVTGTASDKLFGVAEGLWEPDLEPEDLFETISQTLMNAVDRDAYSGWGAVVHVITPDKVITRTLKGRMD
ncbi:20S proteasome subunit beta 3 [Auriscalpium vulgare]|uniref:20S proteasome subunit beta 3 n=1 Tax=Auriscalpium vulgare TaxID=40419 RepID=A0ACB8S0C8_9AGAM|nr:20S proteasome subunit beta 3 [Auriscalpium vulgare]